ncbi:MAG: sensor histidine kinase, partial [Longimicrobiales bacterium]
AEPVWMLDVEETGKRFPLARDGVTRRTWAVLPLTLRDRPIGALALGFPRTVSFGDDDRTFLALLGQQCAQALDRARLYQAERGARVRAEFAERQLSFLAEASSRLAASFDYETTLASVAQLIVPDLADWCTIHVVERGHPRLVALVHRDADRGALLRDMEAQFPIRGGPAVGLAHVLATGEPVLVPRIDDARLRERAQSDEHLALLRRLRPGSEICVPIKVRDRVLGALRFVSDSSRRRYTTTDLALAEELAARAAQAIENAQLYENTRLASQAKSDFLGVMSHELRTPLNAILGYADLVLLGVPEPVGEHAQHHVERVRTAAQHLLQLVDEVLSYARLESGKEVARIEPVDVGTVIRESAALIQPLAERKGLALRTGLPDPAVQLATDGWKVRQIISNLLANAVKFTADGEVEVTAAVDGSRVVIAVRDTGIGIPPEHLEHIFEPFWQVEHSATRRFGGTGLGLGVARRLARLLGGDLTARSEAGEGSTFTLTLPLESPP